ncbi:hypothetical protein C2S53_001995 [Perilla frutescens var. hirtella]|uniref:Uncharacterized protein n=1 Tax=Perilla frutescens var. hirtella TaxID=608512 RepID=A0AAD4IPP2_PERFH|nr:hypothetical protein C2S53_001995 [Perilla frutescens var. hirtella]
MHGGEGQWWQHISQPKWWAIPPFPPLLQCYTYSLLLTSGDSIWGKKAISIHQR